MNIVNRLLPAALVAGVLGLTLAAPAAAAPRTLTLSVPSMDCVLCAPTIRTALQRLHGVHVVAVDAHARTMRVALADDAVTNADVTRATANAGFPSTIVARAATKGAR